MVSPQFFTAFLLVDYFMEKTDADFLQHRSISCLPATRCFFGGGKSAPAPAPAPAPPTQIKAAEVVADTRRAVNERRRRGFASTIMTSATGVANQAPAAKALLGG